VTTFSASHVITSTIFLNYSATLRTCLRVFPHPLHVHVHLLCFLCHLLCFLCRQHYHFIFFIRYPLLIFCTCDLKMPRNLTFRAPTILTLVTHYHRGPHPTTSGISFVSSSSACGGNGLGLTYECVATAGSGAPDRIGHVLDGEVTEESVVVFVGGGVNNITDFVDA